MGKRLFDFRSAKNASVMLLVLLAPPSMAREVKVTEAVKKKIEAGEMYLFNGALHNAIDAFKAAVELDKNSWQAHADLAQALMKVGEPAESEEEYKAAIALNPKETSLSVTLGTVLFKEQKFADAAAVLEKVQGPASTHDDFRNMLANSYAYGGQPEKAKAIYSQLHEHNPKNVDFILGLAASYFKLGKAEEARKQIDLAIKDGLTDSRLVQLKGEMLEDGGNKKAAKESFEMAAESNSNNAEAFISLGNLNLNEGNFEESGKNFTKALKLQPENIEALLGMAYSQEHLGEMQGAVANFKRAASLESDDHKREVIFNHLGEAQFANFK